MITNVRIFIDVQVVLFDLDGTIADTNEIIMRTLLETLEAMSGRSWSREVVLPLWGVRLRDQLLRLYPEIDIARAEPFYRQRYQAYHGTLLREFPGTRAMLEALRASGRRLGVVTSKKRANATQTVDDLGFHDLMEIVVAIEDTPRMKPAPDPLLFALHALGVSADAAIYVGDNPDDIHAARAAGMRSVAVGWSLRPRAELMAAGPDMLIESPGDILEHL
jgi:pyrophosphatase PpaX